MAVSSVTKTLKHRLNLIQILTSLFPLGKVTIPANQLQLTLDGRRANSLTCIIQSEAIESKSKR